MDTSSAEQNKQQQKEIPEIPEEEED